MKKSLKEPRDNEISNRLIILLQNQLNVYSKSLVDFPGMPEPIMLKEIESENTFCPVNKKKIADTNDSLLNTDQKSILATKNENVDMINTLVMDKLPATHDQTKTYLSADSVADDDQQGQYSIEFPNTLTPSGTPPHRLYMKKNAPIIVLS
ncbi:unnamed protein product [Mytilus coruscus]|uniref:Uncharacterized protein n=1 Tax=Mytilus coruscus TaxID=42192 RepID=A0A6J8E4J6_MYTCO|nr:unnamed protein product [Mytilus coruscus]